MPKPRLTEDQLQQRIIDLAPLRGWHVAHFRPARTAKGWRTPMTGNPGFPDLVLARNGQLIVAELKSDRGQPTTEQLTWLDALGPHARLWRPADWPTVLTELTKPSHT